jgi:hypothetical protein
MRRNAVKSSVIASLGYDRETNVLEVEFHTGRVYQYFLIPPTVYEALKRAESIGAYFNRHIRDRYRCVEVT